MLAPTASLTPSEVSVLKRTYTMLRHLAIQGELSPDESKEAREATNELYDVISRHDGWPNRDRRRKLAPEMLLECSA